MFVSKMYLPFLIATTVVTADVTEFTRADISDKTRLHELAQEISAMAHKEEAPTFDATEIHDSEQLELDDAAFAVDLTHTGVCGETSCWELFEREIHSLEMDDETKALLAKAERVPDDMTIVHDPLRRRGAYGAPDWCYKGILVHGDTCCASSCGTCGGSSCATRPGGASMCCGGEVRKRECEDLGDVGCKIPDDHGHVATAGSAPDADNGECWLSIHTDLPECHLFTSGRFTPWYDASYGDQTCEQRVAWWQGQVWAQCYKDRGDRSYPGTEVVWMGDAAAQLTAPESRIIMSWGGDLHRTFESHCQVRDELMPVIWDEDGEVPSDALGFHNFMSTDGTWDGYSQFESPNECALACARNDDCVDWWYYVDADDHRSCLGFDASRQFAARSEWPEWIQDIVTDSIVGKPCINELPVCFAEIGYDYNGNDINNVEGVPSAEDCANRCYDFMGCMSWTWSNEHKICHMKKHEPMDPQANRRPNGNYVSGGPCIRGVGSKAMANYGWTSSDVAKEVFANLMMEGSTGAAQSLAWALVKSGFYMGLTALQQTAFHNAWNWFLGFNMNWALTSSAVGSLATLPYSLISGFATTFVFVVANVAFDAYEAKLLQGCTPDCYSNHCNPDGLPWWTSFMVGNGGYGNFQDGVTYRERGVILLTGCCSWAAVFSTDQCNLCCPDGRALTDDERNTMTTLAYGVHQHGINPDNKTPQIVIPDEWAAELEESGWIEAQN